MSDLTVRTNDIPQPSAPVKVTNSPSVLQKCVKFIWPVAIIAALALGFVGGQQSRQSCADAVSKIDGAMLASQMDMAAGANDLLDGWSKASSSLLDEYNADADKCLN